MAVLCVASASATAYVVHPASPVSAVGVARDASTLAAPASVQAPPPQDVATVDPTAAEPWMLTHPATSPHELEGYATATSVNPGDPVGLAVSTKAATFSGSVYRMGWAGGRGGLQMQLFGPRLRV